MAVETLPLTANQIDQYHRDGFLLASGLIPEAIARTGEATMWEVMGMDPDRLRKPGTTIRTKRLHPRYRPDSNPDRNYSNTSATNTPTSSPVTHPK